MINRLNGFISELEKLALKLEGAPNTVFARGENQEANIGRQRLSSADKSGIINRAQKRVPDFSELRKDVKEQSLKKVERVKGMVNAESGKTHINVNAIKRARQEFKDKVPFSAPASVRNTFHHEQFHKIPVLGRIPIVGEVGARVYGAARTKGHIGKKVYTGWRSLLNMGANIKHYVK